MFSLEKIKNNPFPKIGLITEPPDFSFEKQLIILREKYDFIQIPTLLTDVKLMEDFKDMMNLDIKDPVGMLRKLTLYEFYEKFIKLHGEFVLNKMAEQEIYKPTVYHLPPLEIEYSKYFDQVIVLTNDGTIDQELLKEHVEEENFPIEVEIALIETQRKYFTRIYKTGIWNASNI